MDSFNPLDVLREEMENEEISNRVNAVHRIRIVSSLLAADKIKSQLIPYIDQLIKKEEDEVLFALAEELGNIAQMMPNQPLTVLPQLEMLAYSLIDSSVKGFDETVVREQSIKSIIKICSMVSDADINGQIIPMLFRLANNESNFTCRVSAVNLMCPLYPRAGNQKEKIRQYQIKFMVRKFTELCNEETPMVRRAVAIKIGEIAQFMDKVHVINDLIPIQRQLCQDEQDQVRLLCMESLKNMAKILNASENKTNTLPLIIQAAEDKSWRVRLALSKIFAELSEAEGKEIADSSLIQIFSNLLKDTESDVRVVAVQSLAKFIKFVSPEKLQLIVPQLQVLCRDSMAHVKSHVTEVVAVIVTLLPKEYSQNKLGSYLLEMMSDENSDVRKGAAKASGKFAEAVGVDALNLFAPALKQGMEDTKWRVRKEIILSIINLALYTILDSRRTLKNQDLYTKYLEQSYLSFMKDRASEVRQIGLEKLPEIIQAYKSDQMLSNLLNKINENLQKDKGHVFRGCALYAVQQIGSVVSPDIVVDKLLPLALKNLKDPVPNIRFISVKVAKSLQKRIEAQSAINQIKQAISELQNDTDRDVAFFANEALQY